MTKVGKWILAISLLIAVALGAYFIGASQAKPPITREATFTATILAPADFSLSLDPSSTTLHAGSIFPIGVTITPINQFAGVVNLSVSGLPAGATASFFPSNSITVGGGPAGVQINVSTSISTPPAVYPIKVTATSTSYNE